MQSVATAPRGDRSQAALRVPHAGALRPCRASSCSVCFATSPVRMVEHPTGPFASGFQRPSLRGVVRAQARTEARAWRVTRRRLETRRAMPAAPVAGRGGQPSAKPPASDLAAAGPEASPPFLLRLAPHAGFRRTAPRPGCPDGEEGKGAPVPSPAPAEGTATLAEAREDGRGRGWSARLVLSGSGRRPGSGVSGETIAREACLRRRSQPWSHPPVGRGWQVRRPAVMRARRCEHPRDPGRPRTLRCSGVRPVSRAEE